MESQISISSSAGSFLEMIKASQRGKLKIYLGLAAGVGKTYRMLLEGHELVRDNIDVFIGYIETHGRKDTVKLLEGLPAIRRRQIFYKGKQLEEMDIDAILLQKPQVVLVDELAHTNVPGSRNEKRWQDVIEILNNNINVITTVNIQHLESIKPQVEKITGIEIKERVPDQIIQMADEVVNIDLTIEELIDRLNEGKIYDMRKVSTALQNFFQKDKLLQLRDLALKEVSRQVERKIIREIPAPLRGKMGALITCISSNAKSAAKLIRRSSRLASFYNSKWSVVYVQTPKESPTNINIADQRHLINNLKLATELGAEVVELYDKDRAKAIAEYASGKEAGLIIIGAPSVSFRKKLFYGDFLKDLTKNITNLDIDILLISKHDKD
jgi:two-component system sensor histidine kinase KdpD